MAEDYPMNQLLAKSLFDKWGLNLTVVGNGKELLNDLNTNSYDIILMDIQMPEIDGLEATRKLRQRGIKSPVIAITAHAFKEEQEQCIKAGMNDFISKPFKEDDLKEKLITFLNLKPGDFNSISKYQQKNEMPLSNDLNYFKLDYIKEMGAGDNEFVSQMLEMFIEQVPVLLNEMIDSINKGNKKELSKFAHTIQSSFVMVERSDVKSDLKRLELWGKGQEPLDNPIGELESVIEKSKPILQSIADYLGKTINITYNPIEIVTNVDNLIEISIDFGKIEELAEGDKQFVKGMLDLYIGQTSGQLDDIRGLSKLKQFKPTSLIFHNMIASFDLIGCENLMNYSRRLENAAKENSDIDKLQTMVDQFISLTESTFELVKSKAKEDFDLEI
jgi:CheY-like chemotaxis protein